MIIEATSEVPPEEMNGRGFPRRRQHAYRATYVEEGLSDQHNGATRRDHLAEIIRRVRCNAHARDEDDEEQTDNQKGAEHAELLADYREDEVALGTKQVLEPFMGVADAHTEQPAFSDGVVRAYDVVPRAIAVLAVVPRVEVHHAVSTIAHAENGDEHDNDPATHKAIINRVDTPPIHMTARIPTAQIRVVPRSDCDLYMNTRGASTKMSAWMPAAFASMEPARRS